MLPETLTIFTLGLINGTTVCAFSCMPVLGPFIMGHARGGKHGMLSFLSFGAGKVLGYSFLGGIAAYMGKAIPPEIGSYVRPVSAIAIVIAASTILFGKKKLCGCKLGNVTGLLSIFGYGLASSFLPCPSLAAVMLSIAGMANVYAGVLSGFVFALGILISPLLIVCGGIGFASRKISLEIGNKGKVVMYLSFLLLLVSGLKILVVQV